MKPIAASDALFFYYDPAASQIPFANGDTGSFFEASFDARAEPPFAKSVNFHDLEYITKEWHACLALGLNESRQFSFKHTSSSPNLIFDFAALGVILPSKIGSIGVLFHVKKSTNPATTVKSAPNTKKDYAEFIELAGHDLDAPLRKTSVLLERLVARMDVSAESAGYISRIQASLGDMRTMLDGLSTLSALATTELQYDECDLNALIKVITESLPEAQRGCVSIKDKLPVLQGDLKQYRLLFENLINNALLFKSANQPPIIEISAEPTTTTLEDDDKAYYTIMVSDNGVGFRPEYAEKIFRPFVRLHGKSEYAGHGMGLAIAKRIVENHQGKITAESNTGAGARFILILPQTMT